MNEKGIKIRKKIYEIRQQNQKKIEKLWFIFVHLIWGNRLINWFTKKRFIKNLFVNLPSVLAHCTL